MQQNSPAPQNSKYTGTRRRLRVLIVVLICFLAWAGTNFWEQIGKVNAKMNELKMAEAELDKSKEENLGYKQEILRLNDKEYIEQKARKDFQMKRPGEKLYITPKSGNE